MQSSLLHASFKSIPARIYSLAEFVDLEEAHNPETRVAWEWSYANNYNLIGRSRYSRSSSLPWIRSSKPGRRRSPRPMLSSRRNLRLLLAQARLQSALAQEQHSRAVLTQSRAQHEQAQHAVTTLEPLVNQRGARASAVRDAPLQSRQLPYLRTV